MYYELVEKNEETEFDELAHGKMKTDLEKQTIILNKRN